jgi:hypothetical protein
MKVILVFISVSVFMLLSGCEEDQNPQPSYEERQQLLQSNGPWLVSGPIKNLSVNGMLHVELPGDDKNPYFTGEFVSGNKAYYIIINREVWQSSGLSLDKENRYSGEHTIVISDQEKVKMVPHNADFYEVISIDKKD